jgi:hypothetical protein
MTVQRRSLADVGPLWQRIGIVGAGMVGSASVFAMPKSLVHAAGIDRDLRGRPHGIGYRQGAVLMTGVLLSCWVHLE